MTKSTKLILETTAAAQKALSAGDKAGAMKAFTEMVTKGDLQETKAAVLGITSAAARRRAR